MSKLAPAAGVDVRHDIKEHQAYLDRLWTFASRLGPQHNSLKANVLYQRLVFDRTQDVWDKDRFIEYLKLPRPVWYINPQVHGAARAAQLPGEFVGGLQRLRPGAAADFQR